MAVPQNFYQGEDVIYSVLVTDSTGADVDLTDVAVQNVRAVFSSYQIAQDTFALNDLQTGEIQLTINGTNEVLLKIPRSRTKNYTVGTIKVSVMVDYTDVEFALNRREEFDFNNLGYVLAGDARRLSN